MFSRVLFFFFALIALSAGQSWVGTWSDGTAYGGYGGNLYLCASGNEVFGVYSETGYMTGVISGNMLIGNWYEPGLQYSKDDSTLTRGTFNLTLSSDGNSFSGYYYFANSEDSKPWFSTKTSSVSPTAYQCFSSSATPGITLNGRWISSSETFDICLSTTLTNYSGSFSDGLSNAYSRGMCYDLGEICQGEWFDSDGVWGSFLMILGNDNTLFQTWWTGATADINYAERNVPGVHGYNTDLIRYSDTPVNCAAYDTYDEDPYSDSSSSQLSSFLAVAFALFSVAFYLL